MFIDSLLTLSYTKSTIETQNVLRSAPSNAKQCKIGARKRNIYSQ